MQKEEKRSGGSGGELGVARRGELALQVLDDVERKTADQRDGRHLPQERPGGDEGQVCRRWRGERAKVRVASLWRDIEKKKNTSDARTEVGGGNAGDVKETAVKGNDETTRRHRNMKENRQTSR